jgi:hypothetical protein
MIRKSSFFLNFANPSKERDESDADVNASVNILKRFRLPEHLDPVKFVPGEN